MRGFQLLAQVTLAFTFIDFLYTAWHNAETGFFCSLHLAARTLGYSMPDSIQIRQVMKHICETSSVCPKS